MVAMPGMHWNEADRAQTAPLFPIADLPHLLSGVAPVLLVNESKLPSGFASGDQEDRPASSSSSDAPKGRRQSDARNGTFGKIPMVPGRVSNPGMAWFNKNTCEQLQHQLQDNIDVSQAIEALQGHVWDLSRHPVGCRLVQLALERGNQQEAASLASELKTHVQEAMTSPHANYVSGLHLATPSPREEFHA